MARNTFRRRRAWGILEQLEPRHLLAGVSLDTTFDSDGRALADFANSTDEARSVALQSDGKALVAGQAFVAGQYDFGLARFTADGQLDSTFGSGGRVTTSISNQDDYGFDVAVAADGKIVVVGHTFTGGSNGFDMAVVRYLSNGMLDASFGVGGKVVYHAGSGWDEANAVAVQSDGKIIVAGAAQGDSVVVRFNADGTLDNSFAGIGRAVVSLGWGFDRATDVSLLNDGRIVLAAATDFDFAAARLLADGTLDTTFGTGGKVVTSIGSSLDRAESLAVQADGKLLVAGWTQRSITSYDFAVVRYLANGTLDSSWSGDGIATADVGALSASPLGVAIDDQARVIVAGHSGYDALAAWFDTQGTVVASFVDRGGVTLPVAASDVVALSDGRMLAAGSVGAGAITNYGLMRLRLDDASTGIVDLSPGSFTLENRTFTIRGTSQADHATIVFTSMNSFFATIGGRLQVVNPGEVDTIVLDLRGGTDSVTIVLPTGAFTVVTGATTLQISGGAIGVSGINVENSLVFGDGDETAYLYDSPSDDVLYALAGWAAINGGNSFDQVIGVRTAIGWSTAGGLDTAVLFDSTQNDIYYGMEGNSVLTGGGDHKQVLSFEHVYAQSTGGSDTAVLYGTSAPDTFFGLDSLGVLLNGTQLTQATSFDAVYALAASNDVAVLYDSPGNDVFYGRPDQSSLGGSDFYNQANGFGVLTAIGTGGGNDQAFLVDNLGGALTATGALAGLSTSRGWVTVYDFARVYASSSLAHQSRPAVGSIDFALELSGTWA